MYTQATLQQAFTIIAGGRVMDTDFGKWATDNSGPDAFGFYHGPSSLVGYRVDSGLNGQTATISGLTVATGSHQSAAYRINGSEVAVFDGASGNKAAATNTGTGIYGSSTTFNVGGNSLNHFNFFYLFNRALPDNEIWEVLNNPWQIFKPRKRVLYFDAPSFPVLSSLTASYITSSGGRLTVN